MQLKPIHTKRITTQERVVAARMAEIFKVLSDPARLRIVLTLQRSERCVGDISTITELSPSLASHHLRNLRQLNLVDYERRGRQTFYQLADAHVIALLAVAHDHATEAVPRT